jgi:hypothetical protein
MFMKKIEIERTKKGFPCLWESGGGFTNTGEATIIADKAGQPKRAIYVRKRGPLANENHALIPIAVGDYVISANHHRDDFEIFVYRITKILKEEVSIEKIAEFSNGEWDNLPQFLEDAVEAAMEKATCYHCREPHFIVFE